MKSSRVILLLFCAVAILISAGCLHRYKTGISQKEILPISVVLANKTQYDRKEISTSGFVLYKLVGGGDMLTGGYYLCPSKVPVSDCDNCSDETREFIKWTGRLPSCLMLNWSDSNKESIKSYINGIEGSGKRFVVEGVFRQYGFSPPDNSLIVLSKLPVLAVGGIAQ